MIHIEFVDMIVSSEYPFPRGNTNSFRIHFHVQVDNARKQRMMYEKRLV